MRIKTILCPVDRSDISIRALAYATALAREYVARLSVLEVIDWRLPPLSGTAVDLLEMPPEVQADVLGHLHQLAAPARDVGVPTEVGIDVGPVVRRILERAADLAADLVVVGTHGRSGFDRLALGSVAEKVLRKAPCPVLTVPPAAVAPGSDRVFSTVLCAVDFSEPSADALRVAADLARRYRSALVLLHVVDWPFAGSDRPRPAPGLMGGLESRAQDDLAALVADIPAPPQVSTVVLTGRPRDEILTCARQRDADLIVLGVSGHGAVERALLGSTAHGVIRQSDCPVLTVRARADQEITKKA
jgi:nucleotide-binding universal stress UspA family protein